MSSSSPPPRAASKKSSPNARFARGRHAAFDKTGLGLWASLNPVDLDLHQPPSKRDAYLRIDAGKGAGGPSVFKHAKKPVACDPMEFLDKVARARLKPRVGKTSYIPIASNDAPSIRRIHQLERQAMVEDRRRQRAAQPVQPAHDSGEDFEKTALGLFAMLPKKHH